MNAFSWYAPLPPPVTQVDLDDAGSACRGDAWNGAFTQPIARWCIACVWSRRLPQPFRFRSAAARRSVCGVSPSPLRASVSRAIADFGDRSRFRSDGACSEAAADQSRGSVPLRISCRSHANQAARRRDQTGGSAPLSLAADAGIAAWPSGR